jgi:hypothetical protein
MSAVQGASEDRILYWPFATAAGCVLACLIAYSGPFFKYFLFVLFPPFGLATLACDAAGIAKACPLAFALGAAGPYYLYLFFIPLLFLFWGGGAVTVAVIAAMTCIERGFKHAWRRLLSTLILLLAAMVAAANLDVLRRGGDYIYLSAMYPRYTAEIAKLPADKSRFKVWQWESFPGPCGNGVAYDESDAIVSGNRSTNDEHLGPVDVEYRSHALGHFYFVRVC